MNNNDDITGVFAIPIMTVRFNIRYGIGSFGIGHWVEIPVGQRLSLEVEGASNTIHRHERNPVDTGVDGIRAINIGQQFGANCKQAGIFAFVLVIVIIDIDTLLFGNYFSRIGSIGIDTDA